MESSKLKEALAEIERLYQNPETVRMAISAEIHLKDQLQREEDALFEQIEEGKRLQAQEIILNMNSEKLSAEYIAKLTKIPIEEVKRIIDLNYF